MSVLKKIMFYCIQQLLNVHLVLTFAGIISLALECLTHTVFIFDHLSLVLTICI